MSASQELGPWEGRGMLPSWDPWTGGSPSRLRHDNLLRTRGLNYDIIVDFRGFKWLIQTTDFHAVDSTIGIRLNPEDIHIMHKSEYSGLFGDYSSYSAEYDEAGAPHQEPDRQGRR